MKKKTSTRPFLANLIKVPSFCLALTLLLAGNLHAQAPFLTTWDTEKPGVTNNSSITFYGFGNYDIDWDNDGVFDDLGVTSPITHDYGTPGVYQVAVRGNLTRFRAPNVSVFADPALTIDIKKLISIDQWGDIPWTNMEAAFRFAVNMVYNATDAPDLSSVVDISYMFSNAELFNGDLSNWDVSNVISTSWMFASDFNYNTSFNGDISTWDVSNVINMAFMFSGAEVFNQDLSQWDVSSVRDMQYMFIDATVFNQDLSQWDVSSVTTTFFMFGRAEAFNQDLSQWDVSSVTNMSRMFNGAEAFNADLSNWDVSSVTDMSSMFAGANAFNADLSQWDVSSVTDMQGMFSIFSGTGSAFNADLSSWDVSSVTNMGSMFNGAEVFNADLSSWDVSSVTNMSRMFWNASSFDGDVSTWDVSSVTDMNYMFSSAIDFNRDLSNWDVSSVTNMDRMFFRTTSFNQDLSNWDVSKVTDMDFMFYEASAFDQNLGGWDVTLVTTMNGMLSFSGLSIENYDNTLIGWAAQNVQTGVELGSSRLVYCQGEDARNTLINDYDWGISGDLKGTEEQCGASCSADAGTPSGPAEACANQGATYSVSDANTDAGYSYVWVATDGAPNYTIAENGLAVGEGSDFTGSFTDLAAGDYCVHGFSFEGTPQELLDFVAANNVTTGVQVAEAIANGAICGDLIVADCIELSVYSADAGTPSGPAEACANQGATYSVSDANTDAGYSYVWVATDGAPNYTIAENGLAVGEGSDFTGSFTDLAAGDYCVHGFSFEGTPQELLDFVAANNVTTGVQVAEAIANGAICGDLIVADCIELSVYSADAGTPSGPAEACANQGATYSVSDANTDDGFSYVWVATDGAPNYNIAENGLAVGEGSDFTGSFTDLAAGDYCVHGFSFEGTPQELLDFVAANNVTTGVQVAEAIANGAICGDLIVADCIELSVYNADAGTPSGPTEVCEGIDATYSVSDANTDDGFSYVWVATDGAPNYTIAENGLAVGEGSGFTGSFTDLAAGDYCVHGFSFEGTPEELLAFVAANNVTTGVQVAEAIANGAICGDLIVEGCIPLTVKAPLLEVAACNDLVNVTLDEGCGALFTPDMGLEGNFECYNQLEVIIEDNDGNTWSDVGGVEIPGGYAGQTLVFKVRDDRNDNYCWGQVKLEDKTAPTIDCGPTVYDIEGLDLVCNDVYDEAVLAAIPLPEYADNCGGATLSGPVDVLESFDDCNDDEIAHRLTRTWTVTDAAGHSTSCEQIVIFERPEIERDDEEFRYPTKEVEVSCDFTKDFLDDGDDEDEELDDYQLDELLDENGHPTPLALELLDYTGYPTVISASGEHWLDESYCNIGASYQDISEINVCTNTVKIVRQWTIIDWCADTDNQDALNNSTVINHRQIIKFGDFTAPTVEAPAGPITVSANAFDCEGIVTIPGVDAEDNCATDLTVDATLYKLVTVEETNKYGQVTGTREEYQEVGSVNVGDHYGEIELGTTYKVVYVVSDPCGNTAEPVYVLIEAEDDNAPVAVCDDDLHISIGGDGLARITDKDVDEGSWDNCGDVETWVSRKLATDGLVAAYLAKVHDGVGYVLSGYDDKDDSSDADIYVKDLDGDGELDDNETEKILRLKDGMWYTWWEKEIYFLCDDIAERVTIELLAEDEVGLTNICWNDVLIEDKIAPYCEAPADINWDCTELPYGFDPNDDDQLADLFGEATATDNCPDATAVQISKTVDWNCNSGTITRTFQASDARGLTSKNTCTQTINIAPVHHYEMIFPADPAPVVCGEATLDELITNVIACDLLTVNVVNDTFVASGDACYKIKRTYSVINWCEYDGESEAVEISRDEDGDGVTGEHDVYVLRDADLEDGYNVYIDDDEDEKDEPLRRTVSTGYWTYIQYVKVVDDIQPVVEIGGDDVFCSIDNVDCDTEVTIPITVTDECAGPDVEVKAFVDGEQVDVDGTYPNYSITGDYVIGDHELEVHAVDGCRNSELVIKPFTVADCKAPTPICINGLAIELMPTEDGGGAMAVWVSDFVVSGLEDCVGEDNITLSINRVGDTPDITSDGLILTCDDPDTVAVEIYAWDNASNPTAVQPDGTIGGANYDHCVTYVVVQDNMFNLCDPDPAKVGVAGLIANQNNETVENVEVSLSGMMSTSEMTAADGNYAFNSLTPGGDYTITPYKNDDYLNGVSTFDLVLITRHILGSKKLENPYQLIAADINRSRSISTLDLIQLRKLVLSVDTKFRNNTSWRFVPAGYEFPNPTNPWSEYFPEVASYNDLQTAIASGDFVAVKIGDVNGNAIANSLISSQRSIAGVFHLDVEDQEIVAGNEYRVVFTAADLSVQGYQFTLNHDGLELMDIEYGVAKAENFGVIEDGVLTTSWNLPAGQAGGVFKSGDLNGPNEQLFTLVVRADANGQLSEMLKISSRYTRSEAYDAANELLDVELTFNGKAIAEGEYELYQNVPNPFQGQTMISFHLPAATQATIRIQDVTGKTLKVIRGDYARGFNQIRVNSSELPSTGVLYYTLETDKFTASKKMVVISE